MRQADFLVIDGNSLMHRAFHALPPLDDGNGTYTHAVYGFMSMLLKVIAEAKPRYAAVAFDLHGPTFRHLAYTEYKAGRKPMDDMLRPQFPLCKQLLGEMGVCVLESPGFEADDVLGTLAAQCEAAQWTALLVTGDRDALQLVTNTTHVLYTRRGISDTVEFDEKTVLDTFGVSPLQIPDLKGLMGDASDNIPGVPGIGEKTAVKLLHAYGDLDSILDHAEEQTGKLRERLLTHRALAEKSLWLATIRRDAALTIPACDCLLGDLRGGSAAFERVRFQSLLPRLHALYVEEVPPAPVPTKSEKIIWRQLATLSEISSFAKEATNFPYALVWTENVLTLANAQSFIRIDLSHDLLHAGLSPSEVMEAFSPFFTRPNTLILHGAKDFLRSWDKYGFTLQGACVAGDTALAGALLDGQSKVCTLESLAEGGNDAAALWALFGDQIKALDKLGEKVLYETVELPLMRVLLDMERAGFCVDPDVLHKLGATFTIQIETLRAEI
ncbi:MAG: 5'-3' exonuclease H3TH domain-containing protein, partial [Clostridia bacterium]